MKRKPIRWAAALALAGLAGCGSAEGQVKLVPLVGTVIRGGKPLADASLSFVPDPGHTVSMPGTASCDATGYDSVSWLTRSGVAPGKYRVLISASPVAASDTPDEFKNDPYMAQRQAAARQPAASAKASPIKNEFLAEVTGEGGTFDFDVGPLPKASSTK